MIGRKIIGCIKYAIAAKYNMFLSDSECAAKIT
jgi:hypothetical protein